MKRIHHPIAVARLAAALVALAAAVTLTSVATAGADIAKQRAITQNVVVSPSIFAKLEAGRLVRGKPVTASGTFTATEWTIGPILSPHCAPPPQTCVIGRPLDEGTISSTYTIVGKPSFHDVRATVRGTATARGKGGSVTWKFSAPTGAIVGASFPRQGPGAGHGPVTIFVGTGKALITDATGDLAQLKGKQGVTTFYLNELTGALRVGALL